MCKSIDISRPVIGLIGIGLRAGLIIRGWKNVKEQIRKGQIDVVLTTQDVGQNTRKQLLYYCNLHGILLVSMGSGKNWIEQLKLNQKVLGIKKSPLSENFKKMVGA